MARINKILLSLFAFFLPWQIKFILVPSTLNYWEIAIFIAPILVLVITILNFRKIIQSLKNLDKWILLTLIIFDLLLFISVFLSPNTILSIYKYILFLLAFFLFLFLIREKKKLYLLLFFSFSVSCHSIIAIWQFLSQSSWASKFLGLSHHYPWELGTAVIEVNGQRWIRAYGALDHPNILGALTLISIIVCLYYFLFKKNTIYLKLFLYLNFFFSLTALVFSFSRSAWLAFAATIIIYSFSKIRNRKTFYLIIISSFLLLTVFYYNFSNLINTRIFAQGRIEQISLSERKADLNSLSFDSSQQLLFGRGIGASNYLRKEKDHLNNTYIAEYYYQPVHNIFLLLFLEIGLLGLISFISFLIFIIIKYKRNIKNNISLFFIPTLFVFMLFDHWLISLPFGVFALFFLLSFTKE